MARPPVDAVEMWRRRSLALLVLGLCVLTAGLATVPGVLPSYWLRIATNVLMLATVAQGMNLVAGFVGYPAFGNVVFFGVGAYGTAIGMTRLDLPLAVALAVGALAASALVLSLGPLLVRLRGHYFAIATLGLNETMSALAANLTGLTGGGTGLSLPLAAGSPSAVAATTYWSFLGLFAAGLVVTVWIREGRFGHGCRAIRANEEAAAATGVDTAFHKVLAWWASAVLTALAGGLYARWVVFIEPPQVFDMTLSVKAFVVFLLGGAGTVLGPAIGAGVVEMLTTLAWSHLLRGHLLVLGVAIMVMALMLPDGVQSAAARWSPLARFRSRRDA